MDPPDLHFLRAAQGWLALGNPLEAHAELDRILPENRGHPDVLELRWDILAHEKCWEAALEVAIVLIGAEPLRPSGWVMRSYALHELGRTHEAKQHLHAVIDKFPESGTMRYNLACYACQLGEIPEARRWLRKAEAIAGKEAIRGQALKDPDLEPLWQELEKPQPKPS